MKKFLISTVLILSSVPCLAKTSASATLASDYNWRGLSWVSNGVPATQGSINWASDYGLGAGVWATNHATGYQWNPYVYYGMNVGDVALSATAMGLVYPKFTDYNSMDIGVAATWMNTKLDVEFMPNYFGSQSSDIYINISYGGVQIEDSLYFVPSVGYSMFGTAAKTCSSNLGCSNTPTADKNNLTSGGFSSNNYLDYKAAVQYRKDTMVMEFAYTGTTRKNIDTAGNTYKLVQGDDKTVISLTKNF